MFKQYMCFSSSWCFCFLFFVFWTCCTWLFSITAGFIVLAEQELDSVPHQSFTWFVLPWRAVVVECEWNLNAFLIRCHPHLCLYYLPAHKLRISLGILAGFMLKTRQGLSTGWWDCLVKQYFLFLAWHRLTFNSSCSCKQTVFGIHLYLLVIHHNIFSHYW